MHTSIVRVDSKVVGKVTTYSNGDRTYRNASNEVVGRYDYSADRYRRN